MIANSISCNPALGGDRMFDHLKRRDFISLRGGAVAWPVTAHAQQSAKLLTIGFLGQSTRSATSEWTNAFVQRLRELGWIDGRNVAIEYRWGEGRPERFAEIAAEFVRLKVAVFVTAGTPQVLAAKQATSVIPIVFAWRATRLALESSQVWRGRAATSLAWQLWRPILLASGSNFCARSSPASAGWRSWA